ncbi:06cebbea-a805-4d77-ada2-89712b03123e [Sclerotinia trifoliorum]|uniref:06cebbea-a805-4d77-ada2-89712b03123e n=1 Tax=Sclerotinia trifoliorum TaxID=28548 RepID=A0A8H2ZPG8_9HELO|nr:06cebbea-a805-4d77-ada2-89712b03123e [Sclerotinia trifoliorum]
MLSTSQHQRFMLLSHPTPSQSTVTVKTKSSPSLSQVSLTNSAQIPLPPSASLPRATNRCKRQKLARRRRMMRRMMTISQIWSKERTLRIRSNKFPVPKAKSIRNDIREPVTALIRERSYSSFWLCYGIRCSNIKFQVVRRLLICTKSYYTSSPSI